MNQTTIFITGATGFIGRALTSRLIKDGHSIRITGIERMPDLEALGAVWVQLPDLFNVSESDWSRALQGVDQVVHLAGMAHRTSPKALSDWIGFDQINHQATRSLARAVRNHPTVKRLLFLSSVAVYSSVIGGPITLQTPLGPTTPYGKSKLDAELAIREILDAECANWAIFRPVLVYGPDNPGNMARLQRLIQRSIPIPITTSPNRRSFLFVQNLVDAITTFLIRPEVPTRRTWNISDFETVSTEFLVRTMGQAMQHTPRLLPLPNWLLQLTAALGTQISRVGIPFPWTTDTKDKLLGDFTVDCTALYDELQWTPPYKLEEGIQITFGS